MPSAAACTLREKDTIKSVQINRSTAPEGIFDNLYLTGSRPRPTTLQK
jgi:hypothetical protein